MPPHNPSLQSRFRLPTTFRALRHPNYALWFIGQGVSLIGTWMQSMAQQVLIFQMTGSAAALGLMSFIGLLPVIPLSLWGGSITDRFSKKKVIILTNAGMLFQALLLALLAWSNRIEVWHVYVLSFFLAALNAVDIPARQAFTLDLIEGKEDLANAIGLNSAMFNGARALGPAMAGIVVAALGVMWAFMINAFSFVAVIICLLLMRNLPQPPQKEKTLSVISHLAEGFRYVRSNQMVLILFSVIGVSAFLSMPYSTLMPVYAETNLKESARPIVDILCGYIKCQTPEALPLGILLTMVGIGALIGALFVAALPANAPYGKLLTLGNLGFPLLLLIIAFSHSFILSSFVLLFVGISFVLQNALVNTLLQFSVRDELRGRVMSLYSMIFQSMMRFGSFQAGYFADWFGASLSVALGAVVSLAYGIFIAVRFGLHKQNRITDFYETK